MQLVHSPIDRKVYPGFSAAAGNSAGVLVAEAAGYANLAAQTAMTPQTRLRVASVSKPITAAAILMLDQAGTISINKRIRKLTDCLGHSKSTIAAQYDRSVLNLRATRRDAAREIKSLCLSGEASAALAVRDSVLAVGQDCNQDVGLRQFQNTKPERANKK